MVTVVTPALSHAVVDAINVTVAVHVGLQLVGVNALAVTPDGNKLAMLNVTAWDAPEIIVAVTVSTPPAPPPVMNKVAGELLRQKLKPVPVTVHTTARLKLAVLVRPPLRA